MKYIEFSSISQSNATVDTFELLLILNFRQIKYSKIGKIAKGGVPRVAQVYVRSIVVECGPSHQSALWPKCHLLCGRHPNTG